MKKLSVLLLLIILSVQVQAEIKVFGMKAYPWNKFSKNDKIMYVQGIFDGLIFSRVTINETKISTDLSIEQYIFAIDKFYLDYKNALIPVPFILRIITLEINGYSENEIKNATIEYRKQWSK